MKVQIKDYSLDIHPTDLPEHKLAVITSWPVEMFKGCVVVKIQGCLYKIGSSDCWSNLLDLPDSCKVRILAAGTTLILKEE